MSLTREFIEKKAATMGLVVHESVTDERLARINPRMLNGRPERLSKNHTSVLDATREQFERWIEDGCYVAPYDLGKIGEEVIAPPVTDKQLALVLQPSFCVVAVIEGTGETIGDEEPVRHAMAFTILR